MHKIILFIFLLLMISCKQQQLNVESLSFKDSLVNRYLAFIDSAAFHDTINNDFRVLKAYINNDSAFFVKMNEQMDLGAKNLKENPRLDSCAQQQKLSDLGVDEAYRFSHAQSFCHFGQKITITRSGDTIRLEYIEYSNGDGHMGEYVIAGGDTIVVKPYCVISKQFVKTLLVSDWEELEEKIRVADYWGLKPRHYELSTDGSSWEIDAFTKEPKQPEGQQIHSVSRQCHCNSSFEEIGRYFMKLSGEKSMCGEFF